MLFKNINSLVSKSWKCFFNILLGNKVPLPQQSKRLSNNIFVKYFTKFLWFCHFFENMPGYWGDLHSNFASIQLQLCHFQGCEVVNSNGICWPSTHRCTIHWETHHDTWQNWPASLTWDRNTMKKCFLSTYYPSCNCVLVGVGSLSASSNCKL